jgi:hypothetical protein
MCRIAIIILIRDRHKPIDTFHKIIIRLCVVVQEITDAFIAAGVVQRGLGSSL